MGAKFPWFSVSDDVILLPHWRLTTQQANVGISRGRRPLATCRSYPVARRLARGEDLPLELFVATSWSNRRARFTELLSGNA